MKNKIVAIWTDWNRKGANGKYGGVGWYRIINPFGKLKNTTVISGEDIMVGGKDRIKAVEKMAKLGNIWVIKYVDDWKAVNHLLTMRDVANKFIQPTKLIVDLDDDMFSVHPHNYAYRYHYPGSPKNEALKYLIQNADALTVSTQPLKHKMKQYNDMIEVLPNTIDESIWGENKKHKGKLRIGWILSANHEQDIPVVIDAIKEILKKYEIIFYHIGWDSPHFDALPQESHKFIAGTSGYKEYPEFLASLGLDISIAPIIDDEFNKSKSNIKWMEAAMLEIPTVASNVYPYEHSIKDGETGFLAGNTKQWVNALSKLIESEELRRKIGKQAKEVVIKEYNVKDVINKYKKFFNKLN